MTTPQNTPPQTAVWFFVFDDAPPWVRWVTLTVGLLVVVAGGVQLGREVTQRRSVREQRSSEEPPDAL
ncbi:hypothetical protein [uncultured Microbacterium sp.]|uniref:hypothetical protein n=1 Tax=uncultured Microbacterium sp. TaxID=191216 RepID=UPI002617B320|nr:hypothetical protein [uncultured Microbacterium sp.]